MNVAVVRRLAPLSLSHGRQQTGASCTGLDRRTVAMKRIIFHLDVIWWYLYLWTLFVRRLRVLVSVFQRSVPATLWCQHDSVFAALVSSSSSSFKQFLSFC